MRLISKEAKFNLAKSPPSSQNNARPRLLAVSNPQAFNFIIKDLWQTLSKALAKSKNIRIISCLLFKLVLIVSSVSSKYVIHDFDATNPCYSVANKPWSTRCLIITSLMILSITLHGIDVKEISRQFGESLFEPFLKTAVILADFQLSSTMPWLYELWNI